MNFERFKKWYYIVPAAIVAAPVVIAIFVLIFGGIVMWLWNWLLPPLFGLPQLSVWQAFGLLALCRILFGGISGGGGGGGSHSRHMTPGERERIRRRMCRTPKEDQPPSAAPEAGSTAKTE
jgi:hypothetical protein